MEDHDRRRKALRKQWSRARLRTVPELAFWREDEITAVQAIVEGEVDGDLADLFRDLLLSHYCDSSFPAKAA
ncbi:hypothetical protein CDL15_Pgr025062 [Punica granatum]|nr:hypothetical protein CDL15_Pgr025062 [Punica granatum]